MLSATLVLASGSLWAAAPADCLTYRNNPQVAACANQYGPSGGGYRPKSMPTPTPPAALSVALGKDSELRTVAVNRGPKPPPAPEPESATFAVDRAALTNTVIAGAIGGSVLVLVALGFWRWGSKLTKACPYCSSKMGRSARSCRFCFRAV
jgi:hypothetical protein